VSSSVTLNITDADAMRACALRLSALLRGGDVLILDGPLGAGKTTFTQGLGEGLGVTGSVTSPTFVVSRIHRAGERGIGLVHVDAYRLASAQDLTDLELDDRPHDVLVVEWGMPYADELGDSWLEIQIARDDHSIDDADPASGPRTLTISAHGPRWNDVDLNVVGA
jgi:tRNA threonylcarbamoyl adenosine modification protein YjeE